MSSRVAIGLSAVFVAIAIFNAWREENNKRLDAEDRIALLEAENASLKSPSATIEIRYALLETFRSRNREFGQNTILWRLFFDVYICPAPERKISFPLHRCKVAIRAGMDKCDQRKIEKPNEISQADFMLIMAMEDTNNDIHTITAGEAGVVQCSADAHTLASDEFCPPQNVTAVIVLQDSQGHEFEALEARMEKRLAPGSKMLWEMTPTL